MFTKILIANRGEIAIRVIRACKELGVATVAVYSEADRAALHVRAADEAYCIGPAPSRESYLNGRPDAGGGRGAAAPTPSTRATASCPRTPDFAEACAAAGIAFIGPNPKAIRVMGNKTTSRVAVYAMGVPLVPGMRENLTSEEQAVAWAGEIGFPLMMKAAAGGGGKGLRQVPGMEDLAAAYRAAKSESLHAFGDDAVYLERYIEHPRHIEIQVLGDQHGNIIYFPERECSIQRRHQKVIEEAPSTLVDPEMRRAHGRGGGEGRPVGGLRFRRHGGVHRLRQDPGVLLPGDEHPAPGGAPHHRDDHRHRPVQGDDQSGRRVPPAVPPGGRARCTATPWSAGSTPRTRTTGSCPPPAGSSACACPAAPGCGTSRACTKAWTCPSTTTPCSASWWSGAAPGSAASPA